MGCHPIIVTLAKNIFNCLRDIELYKNENFKCIWTTFKDVSIRVCGFTSSSR